MRVITPKEMVRIEKLAYSAGASEESFMELAGIGIADHILKIIRSKKEPRILLLCGKGNNAGDTYVAGTSLLKKGFTVFAYSLVPLEECSLLCKRKAIQFSESGGIIHYESFPSQLAQATIIVDGLFGTGFQGSAREPYDSVIEKINQHKVPVVSVDIPSGLNGTTGEVEGSAIHADFTIYLGLPKVGFFLRQGWNHVGRLQSVDFGLEQTFIEQAESDYELLSKEKLPSLPPIIADRHKYQTGAATIIAGSPGMPGAALMASKACLRSGAGIVHLFHPDGMQAELAFAPYELIRLPYSYEDLSIIQKRVAQSNSVLFGPGIGTHPKAEQMLKTLLPMMTIPTVIDADGLTILSRGDVSFPTKSILTPHRGEMSRLLGISPPKQIDESFLNACSHFSEKNSCVLIVKGGPSYLFVPGQKPSISHWGTPGMATAGTGDVFSGILTALLAQGVSLHEAGQLGLYLHGISGEIAEQKKTSYNMIAGDLISCLYRAFRTLL